MRNYIGGIVGKITSVVALASIISVAGAQEIVPERGARAKIEYSGNFEENHTYRLTLGTNPRGYSGRIVNSGQFGEYFRLYDVESESGGSRTEHTSVGAKVNVGDARLLPFASAGDIEGAGVEGHCRFGNASATVNIEGRTEPSDATRLGGAVNYEVGNTLVTAAFDNVKTDGLNTDQVLGSVDFTPNKENSFGVAYVDSETNDSHNRGIHGYWINQPAKGWGLRARGHATWNNELDSKNYTGELILAQRPTTGRYGGSWTIERNVANAGLHNSSVIPISVNSVEGVPLFGRSKQGWSVLLKGGQTEVSGNETGFVEGGIGFASGFDNGKEIFRIEEKAKKLMDNYSGKKTR